MSLFLITKHEGYLLVFFVLFLGYLYIYRKDVFSFLIFGFLSLIYGIFIVKFHLIFLGLMVLGVTIAFVVYMQNKSLFPLKKIGTGLAVFLFSLMVLAVPRGKFESIDLGHKETKIYVVDLGCPHCIEELKEEIKKSNLKLKLVSFTQNQVPNYYFLCSQDKGKALREIVSGDYDLIPLIHCNLTRKAEELLENTQEVVSKGIYGVPYSY